jgi:DnaK suppressor protein
MKGETREELRQILQRQRDRLWQEAVEADSDLRELTEIRESELEEAAQQDRMARLLARLDVRAKREIEEIDAALERMARGTYGRCQRCQEWIALPRLRALPATRLCVPCMLQEEELGVAGEAEEEPGTVPTRTDATLLSDRELETELREMVRQDGRVDMEELRVVCRHEVAYLVGAVPSEAEHQILRKLVTDVEGLRDVVDRIAVKEVLWEREDRTKEPAHEAPSGSATETEDVVKSIEEGLTYSPPDAPPPEEED